MSYTPDPHILKKYADVLVKFALGGGKGVQKGEVVYLIVPECAKPILEPLQIAILESGANFILEYRPNSLELEGMGPGFFNNASLDQLSFVPKKYIRARVDAADHFLMIIAEDNPYLLKGVVPEKLIARRKALRYYMDLRTKKENAEKLTWTVGLFGTSGMAQDVGMSIEEYWDQIIKACFLDEPDPLQKWRELFIQIEETKKKLDSLQIDRLHIEGDDADLVVKIGEGRQWLGGSGRNIPSFELFTSPDWRGTEGWIRFNQPLYRYGNRITGIRLEFEGGKVVRAQAEENQELLTSMIGIKNADKIGEFSLTDLRFSRITRFMGETLYDENMGGEFGNTHVALGAAYKDAHPSGTPSKIASAEWKRLGYNESAEHCDIISTTNRTVTATLASGEKKVIYKDGEFQI